MRRNFSSPIILNSWVGKRTFLCIRIGEKEKNTPGKVLFQTGIFRLISLDYIEKWNNNNNKIRQKLHFGSELASRLSPVQFMTIWNIAHVLEKKQISIHISEAHSHAFVRSFFRSFIHSIGKTPVRIQRQDARYRIL